MTSNKNDNWHYDTLSLDTISGIDLRIREIEMIRNLVGLDSDEKIEIIYRNGGGFEKYFQLTDKQIVGVTNKRIFQIVEGGIFQSTLLCDIKSILHVKKNIFRWDQIIVEVKQNKKFEYGIYYSDTTAFFVKYLNQKII